MIVEPFDTIAVKGVEMGAIAPAMAWNMDREKPGIIQAWVLSTSLLPI
jgi:hypothetical protein